MQKHTLLFFLFSFFLFLNLSAQPLSGEYTIGGDNPDFERIQEAADSLIARGVDGPVRFLIRPGIYEEAGGSERILFIEEEIPGISGENMITFQPDPGQGGDVNNVIWQRTSQTGSPGGYVVEINYGYVQLKELTIQNADTTSEGIAPSLIHIYPNTNLGADSVFIENCRLIGDIGNRKSYDAIKWNRSFNNMRFINNTISGCHNGIRHWLRSSGSQAKGVVISGNHMTGLQTHRIGGSGTGGYGIRLVEADSAVIMDNVLDYADGASMYRGIFLSVNLSTIENNKIMDCTAGSSNPRGLAIVGHDNRIFNNMVTGLRRGQVFNIYLDGSDNQFMHNSILIPQRDVGPGYANNDEVCLYIAGGSGNEIKNNIFVNLAYNSPQIRIIRDYWGSDTTNIFDSNIYYHLDTQTNKPKLMTTYERSYVSLEEWQESGQDLNSKFLLPEFIDMNRDLHLDGCSVVDPDLLGLPLTHILTDIDGDTRSIDQPMIGMDEATEFPQQRFSHRQHYGTGQIPVSSAFLPSSSEGAQHVVIANAGSENMQVFSNDGSGNLSLLSNIALPAAPKIIKTADVDQDGFYDIVAALDTTENNVAVFWGAGETSFEPMEYIGLPLRAEDIELADIDGDRYLDLVFTELGVVGADSGWVGAMPYNGQRDFSDSVWIYRGGEHPGDLVVAHFNEDSLVDVAVVDDFAQTVYVMFNRGSEANDPELWDGFQLDESYMANVQSPPLLPGFTTADFDNDGDMDMIINHAESPDSLVLFRNDGTGGFRYEKLFLAKTRFADVFTILDYENDGDMDIVTGNSTFDLTLYINDGNGSFERALMCQEGKLNNEPRMLLAGMLDGNAFSDILALPWTLSAGSDSVALFMNLNTPVSVANSASNVVPELFDLLQNYPNPFNPETQISFRLHKSARVFITVYNMLGQKVEVITNRYYAAGIHTVRFSCESLSSGMYVYKMEAGGKVACRRMLLIK